jgi:hypothetical protein
VVRALPFALSALSVAMPGDAVSSCDSTNHSEIVSPHAGRLAPASFKPGDSCANSRFFVARVCAWRGVAVL